MSGATAGERIAKGEYARQALHGLDYAQGVVIADYTTKLQKIAADTPWETGKISKLAIALRVVDEVVRQLNALVVDGELAQRETSRAQRIADLPEAKRRRL